jgi:hypothetical protein
MHLIVIPDNFAGAVVKFFLKHEVLLNLDSLSNGSSFDIRACSNMANQLNRLFVNNNSDRYFMLFLQKIKVHLAKMRGLIAYFWSLTAEYEPEDNSSRQTECVLSLARSLRTNPLRFVRFHFCFIILLLLSYLKITIRLRNFGATPLACLIG